MYLYNDGQKIDLISYTELARRAPTIKENLNMAIAEKSQKSKKFKKDISDKKKEILKAMSKGESTDEKEEELKILMDNQRKEVNLVYMDVVISDSERRITINLLPSGFLNHSPLWDDNSEISIIAVLKIQPSIFLGKVRTPFDPNQTLIQLNKRLVNLEITDKNIEQTIKTIDNLSGSSNPDVTMAPAGSSQFSMMGSAFSAPLDLDSINVQAYLGAKLETKTPEKREEIKTLLEMTEKYNEIKERMIKKTIAMLENAYGTTITPTTKKTIALIQGLLLFNKTIRVRGNTNTSLAKALKAAAKNPTGEKKEKKQATTANTPSHKLAKERGVIPPGSNKTKKGKGKGKGNANGKGKGKGNGKGKGKGNQRGQAAKK
ncbi:hypothetical protein GUITHDRAFT_120178 [Guillardia theta CCMP2712]|uniref:Uncharacterized protein n=1 Tax=Guillardia theta (strain CCMP2712) TaxID=905079 RepID=L1ICT5_GUITC|nr:hypothetical protein GUITHDRAFT_120178 [Guillardia theta CCMP2712]EKX33650.1 hypothetical protein GUITHDRAFT_120178 [Guillardia theta CCMP2712]|eukprot:XP_005820630.1 hypothetical protein GUITHDRAFT_120178 [Guillardia theta CCMP2712]